MSLMAMKRTIATASHEMASSKNLLNVFIKGVFGNTQIYFSLMRTQNMYTNFYAQDFKILINTLWLTKTCRF
jgi:hypothetical protein